MRAIIVAGLLALTVAIGLPQPALCELTPAHQTSAKPATAPRASFQGRRVASPWGKWDMYGGLATRAVRRTLALLYARKLEEADFRRGVVITDESKRIIPAGDGVDRSGLRRDPWRPVVGAVPPGFIVGPGGTSHAFMLHRHGVPLGLAKRAAQHVRLGLPTRAALHDDNDYLLADGTSVISYNRERQVMNWTSWRIGPDHVAQRIVRADTFGPDSRLPVGWYRPSNVDFLDSGYDPGHMVASGDRQIRFANVRTYRYTNMLPQAPNNNQGPWVAFEHYLQGLAKAGSTIHVIAGGGYTGPARTIGRGVAVPDTTWKIAVIVPPGKTLEGLGADARVIAINVPNRNHLVAKDAPFTDYLTNVSSLENLTGYHFLGWLPPDVAKALKVKVDNEPIPLEERVSAFARRPPN